MRIVRLLIHMPASIDWMLIVGYWMLDTGVKWNRIEQNRAKSFIVYLGSSLCGLLTQWHRWHVNSFSNVSGLCLYCFDALVV